MPLNGLKEKLEGLEGLNPENLEQITKIVDGLADPILESKQKILDDLKKAKANGDVDPAELEALRQLKANVDQKQAEDKHNYEEALNLAKQNASRETEEWKGKYEAANAQLESILIDKGLSDELDGVHVDPNLKAGAVALLRQQVKIEDGRAMIGDKSLSDHVAEWADSDTGKAFTLAPDNSGGRLIKRNNGETVVPNKPFTKMTVKERRAHLAKKMG